MNAKKVRPFIFLEEKMVFGEMATATKRMKQSRAQFVEGQIDANFFFDLLFIPSQNSRYYFQWTILEFGKICISCKRCGKYGKDMKYQTKTPIFLAHCNLHLFYIL